MTSTQSRIDQARALLATPVDRAPNPFAALGAAALAATAAIMMAGVMVLGAGVALDTAATVAAPE